MGALQKGALKKDEQISLKKVDSSSFCFMVVLKKNFREMRAVSWKNITTWCGVYLRMCRSIQVEGAFGLLKNDFGLRRFLTRGKANIRTELFFLALAYDLKKLWMKRENGRLKTHLSEITVA